MMRNTVQTRRSAQQRRNETLFLEKIFSQNSFWEKFISVSKN